jgi:hypothetical protein
MKRALLSVLAGSVLISQAIVFGQGPPKSATYLTKEQIDAVNKTPGVDRTLMVWDLGKIQYSVGIIHRGATGAAAAGGGGGAGGGRAAGGGAAAAGGGAARGGGAAGGAGAAGGGAGRGPATPCGEQASTPPSGGAPGMISHDFQTEGYLIVSGGGTLITGGRIVNGSKSAPDAEVTKILNGPSCSGMAVGDIVRKQVKQGDVIIIPAGVPHGWTDITDHVDYLSFRPIVEKELQPGYVNPSLPKQ